MPGLVLGPLLRHVGERDATVWVETDGPCEVAVLGCRARTFAIEGHHYAIVPVEGLRPGGSAEYEIHLDGDRVWPEPGSPFPPSVIRTLDPHGPVRLVFGSCRVSLPHEPPFVLGQSEHPSAHGIDALRAMGLRMARVAPEARPHVLLMLGDQVYADDLSPAMRDVAAGRRRDPDDPPPDELCDFPEYALAYREAWGDPVIRWMLSTLPSSMIFDDHEIHAEWKISQEWVEEMRGRPWYDRRVTAGLMAYWTYQHLGNLSPAELRDKGPLRRVIEASERTGDGGAVLRETMRDADRQPGHSRWSFCRDLAHSRLVVVDSRAGRVLTPGARQMVDDGEWAWITERATGDFAHLLLASSVPFVLGRGLHDAEAWNEAVADGVWGRRAARLAEKLRRAGVMDHWAAFGRSFARLAELLRAVASGERGAPPRSIVMLSGDVHHCYLAEVGLPSGTGAATPVWQAVCSAYRKDLSPRERGAMRFANGAPGRLLGRALARSAGVAPPPLGWRFVHEPTYDNQVATLELTPTEARLRIETTTGADWRDPRLRTVLEHRLTGSSAPAAEAPAPESPPARPAVVRSG
jgi:hypothetical protein